MTAVSDAPESSELNSKEEPLLRVRYRLRFAKVGLLRWIGHNDLIRLWERIARRVELPLSMSEGFHRRPRLSFPSALALGIVGLDEVVDVDLTEVIDPEVLLARLEADNQPGLLIHRVQQLPEGTAKARLRQSDFEVDIPSDIDRNLTLQSIDQLRSQDVLTIQRKKKQLTTQISTEVPNLELGENVLRFSLVAREQASLRPDDLLSAIGAADWTERGATITRVKVHLQQDLPAELTPTATRTVHHHMRCSSNET